MILVVPGASDAAMTAFSVAITDASSRKMSAARPACRRAARSVRRSRPSRRGARRRGCAGRGGGGPITSPPGGGTLARPTRASSGPASRNDARIRSASSSSTSCVATSAAWTRTSFGPVQSTSAPRCWSSSPIVSTSRIRGTFVSTTGSSVSRHAAMIGSAPFLFPAARMRPPSGRPPSITKDSAAVPPGDGGRHRGGGYPSGHLGTDPRAGLGNAHALHEERGAPAARAGGRGLDRVVRAALRRGRGAVARDGAAARLRLRDPPDARQASAGRRADPARGGLSGRGRSRRCCRTPSTWRCRATRRSRRRSSPATSSRGSCTPAGSCGRPGSTGSSRSRCARS